MAAPVVDNCVVTPPATPHVSDDELSDGFEIVSESDTEEYIQSVREAHPELDSETIDFIRHPRKTYPDDPSSSDEEWVEGLPLYPVVYVHSDVYPGHYYEVVGEDDNNDEGDCNCALINEMKRESDYIITRFKVKVDDAITQAFVFMFIGLCLYTLFTLVGVRVMGVRWMEDHLDDYVANLSKKLAEVGLNMTGDICNWKM